jgi:acetyltransferase-like isoleucine patch superfamily enzyme
MRKISPLSILAFLVLSGLGVAGSVLTVSHGIDTLDLGDFRAACLLICGFFLTYVYLILIYRVLMAFLKIQEGFIEENSWVEVGYNIHVLFFLVFFYSWTTTSFLPVPFRSTLLRSLGARIGSNSYTGGTITDPYLFEMGKNCLIGESALVFCHIMEGSKLGLDRVVLGDGVTVGAKAAVMPGVRIGDHAIVSTGAVVRKGTVIAAGEVWGGVPARRLRAAAKVDARPQGEEGLPLTALI